MRRLSIAFLYVVFAIVSLPIFPDVAVGNIRIGVMPYISKVDNLQEQQISQLTEVTTRALFGSKGLSVIERENLALVASQNKINTLGAADSVAALKIGRLAGCQYMLIGSVTQLTLRTTQIRKGHRPIFGGNFMAKSDNSEYTYTVELEARLIDVTTGRVFASIPVNGEGSSIQNNMYSNDGAVRSRNPRGEAQNLAIAAAGAKLGDKIREILTGEIPAIIDVNGKSIRINRGLSSGVNAGACYRVYREGAEVHDIDGSSLGRRRTTIAVLSVNNTNDEFSTAEVVENGGSVSSINRGDKLEAITIKEAEAIVNSGIFNRTTAGSDTNSILASLNISEAPSQMTSADHKPVSDAVTNNPASAIAPTAPASQPSPAHASPTRPLENESTDPGKVVATYALSAKDANFCRISHINFRKLGKTQAAYDKFVELFDTYSSDYLAAYWLGEISVALKKKDQAATWYDKALAINPNYVPAQKAKAKLAK